MNNIEATKIFMLLNNPKLYSLKFTCMLLDFGMEIGQLEIDKDCEILSFFKIIVSGSMFLSSERLDLSVQIFEKQTTTLEVGS